MTVVTLYNDRVTVNIAMPNDADFEVVCNVYHKAYFEAQLITLHTDTFTIIGMTFELDDRWPNEVYLPRTTADQTGILVK